MAKGSVKVSKGTTSAPLKGEGERPSPESFGQLFEPLASVRRDIDRFFEGLAPDFPRGIGFDPFHRLSSSCCNCRSLRAFNRARTLWLDICNVATSE